jgi:hypothetical protein
MGELAFEVVGIEPPEGVNLVLGQAHFIKTVEDVYEALAGSSPHLRFGLAFCEASGLRLVRRAGNDPALVDRVLRMTDIAEYKRRQSAPGTKISGKAFGRDRRLPITNRFREGV